MKLVDLNTKITALLWDDEHEEEIEREMTIGDFLDEFTVEGLWEIPLYIQNCIEKDCRMNHKAEEAEP